MGRSDARRCGAAAALLGLLVGLLSGVGVLTASPAAAHATLISTDPPEGAVLTAAPEQVVLTFDESVIGDPGGTTVFDAAGHEVASSAAVRGPRLVVDLDEEVGDGTLVVVWRLVSDDGHPLGGSLRFSVGAPSEVVDVPGEEVHVDTDAPWRLGVLRWLGYLGLLAAAGVAAFSVLFLPGDARADAARDRLRGAARLAAGVAAVGWCFAVPLVALYQLGLGASALRDGETWSALAPAQYAVPAAVVAGLVVAVTVMPVTPPARLRVVTVLAGCGVALAAPALTGHTRAADPNALVIGVDVLHLVAAALWLGGLLAIALVLGDLAADDRHGAGVVARFSTWAAGILAVLVVAGSLLAWRIAGSWAALLDTGYGALLLVKVLLVLVAVALASWNRFVLLPRLLGAERSLERRDHAATVVRTVRVEAGVLVAVLLVTGFLVDRSPEPESAVAPAVQAMSKLVDPVRSVTFAVP